MQSFLDVLVEMEKQEMLSEDSMEELQRILHACNKPLAEKVQEYKAKRSGEKTHLPPPQPVTHACPDFSARGPTAQPIPGEA